MFREAALLVFRLRTLTRQIACRTLRALTLDQYVAMIKSLAAFYHKAIQDELK
jgi:hypothetical protein